MFISSTLGIYEYSLHTWRDQARQLLQELSRIQGMAIQLIDTATNNLSWPVCYSIKSIPTSQPFVVILWHTYTCPLHKHAGAGDT